jgi:hypothetical protein
MLNIFLQRTTNKLKPFLSSWLALLAALAGGISVLGIRGIVLTPLVERWLQIEGAARVLNPLYGLLIVLSLGYLLLYLKAHPLQFEFSASGEDLLIWVGLAAPFLMLLTRYRLPLDFWLDEMISIIRHIKPSLYSVIFSYPAPNNHVFTNLLSNIYLRLIGLHDMEIVLQHPYLLRLPYLMAGAAAVLVTAYTAHRQMGKWAGYLGVILFTTTIPMLNFTAQVRGYAFTLLFSSLVTYFVLEYRRTQSRHAVLGLAAGSFLLLYTIPSNIYYLLSLILFLMLGLVFSEDRLRKDQVSFQRGRFVFLSRETTLLASTGAGMGAAVIFYLPVIRQILNNKYVTTAGLFQGTVFTEVFFDLIQHLISGRGWFFILAGIGLFWLGARALLARELDQLYFAGLNLSLFLLPFLLSFLRGDQPFERVFLVSYPNLLLAAVLGLDFDLKLAAGWLAEQKWFRPAALGLAFIALNASLVFTHQAIRRKTLLNLQQEKRQQIEIHDQRMWASHFLEHYQVVPLVKFTQNNHPGTPVYFHQTYTRYAWTVYAYFNEFGIQVEGIDQPPRSEAGAFYLVTTYPDLSRTAMTGSSPDLTCRKVSDQASVYQLLFCEPGE